MPLVLITRSPWIVTASAPPFQNALTTAWMSCWWTISSRMSWVEELMTSAGASESVIVTPGPVTGVKPAGARSSATWRWIRRTSSAPTRLVNRSTSSVTARTRSTSSTYSWFSAFTSDARSV